MTGNDAMFNSFLHDEAKSAKDYSTHGKQNKASNFWGNITDFVGVLQKKPIAFTTDVGLDKDSTTFIEKWGKVLAAVAVFVVVAMALMRKRNG